MCICKRTLKLCCKCHVCILCRNLFTAAAYTKYQQCEEEWEQSAIEMTEEHLTKAFVLLDVDNSGTLERNEMLVVIAELRKAHLLPGIAQVRVLPDCDTSIKSNVFSDVNFCALSRNCCHTTACTLFTLRMDECDRCGTAW